MSYAYDEATLDLLRLTIPTYGILVPIIQRSGTNEIIDGRHRLKIRDEMAQQGIQIMLPVHHVDTENPAEIDQIVNSVRRPWQDTEHRRKLVAQLREKGHSHQRIADAVGTHEKTIRRDLQQTATAANAGVAAAGRSTSKGKDGRVTRPPATPEEVARAWVMKDGGMKSPAIAKELGRGERTVRDWFAKERPEAVAVPQSVEPEPSPEPHPVSGIVPRQPGAPLPELSKDIIKRERKAAAKRTARLAALVELDAEMTALWKFAQKRFESDGRSVLRNRMGLADDAMVVDGVLSSACLALGIPPDTGYEEMLWAVDALAKRVSRSARQAIYLFGYADGVPE